MYLESYTIVAIGAEEEFLPTSVRYGRTELAINVLLQATSERSIAGKLNDQSCTSRLEWTKMLCLGRGRGAFHSLS